MLATQSSLGLRCVHWEQRGDAGDQSDLEPEVAATLAPIRRRAEQESDQRWSLWGRIRRTFSKQERRTGASSGSSSRVEEILIERSGVGAGTEPCLVCQGRIANLAALTVATPEGDKQTYSVWRCRSCYTCYLNDWIDRWERSESLETEERYYRVAPQEALQLLRMIDGVVDAEHPARRHERTAERQYMIQFIGDRRPLSHEIKQGR